MSRKNPFIIFICLFIFSFPKNNFGQFQNDTTKILTVIQKMVEGMRLGNEKLFVSVFDSSAVLMSVGSALGKSTVHSDDYISYARAVGTPHPQVWDERIANPVIHINGDLASVWAEYSFYLGDKINHCGVDSFQLVKRDDGWKILVIVDTRKREGCDSQ